jgi:hypothetical protein
MFGPSLTSVFRSRWMALLWAGMVIWFAVDVAGPPDAAPANNMVATAATNGLTDVTGSSITKEDVEVLRDFAEGR